MVDPDDSELDAARFEFDFGDRALGIARYRTAAEKAFQAQDPQRYAAILFETIQRCALAGEAEEAMHAYGTLADFIKANHLTSPPGVLCSARAEVWLVNGEPQRAISVFLEAASEFSAGGRPDMTVAMLSRAAAVTHEHDSAAAAIPIHISALEAAEELPHDDLWRQVRVEHLDLLGCAYVASGACDLAIATYKRLHNLVEAAGDASRCAELDFEIGALYAEIGDHVGARGHWEAARASFAGLGMSERAEAIGIALRDVGRDGSASDGFGWSH